MKQLSMWAPWGQLLAYGVKDVENRSWSTAYRGPVALHCTKGGTSTRAAKAVLEGLVEVGLITGNLAELIADRIDSDRGKIIGTADLAGSRSSSRHPSAWAVPGGFALELANARLVEPVEAKGARGLTEIDPAIAWRVAPTLDLGFVIPDVVEAEQTWGANCGPTAIAGALGITMSAVREAVSVDGVFKGYMGVTDFKRAIPSAGGRIVRAWSRPDKRELSRTDGHPIIVLIRFCGPWDGNPRAAATYRHAFAYRHGYVSPIELWNQRARGPGWVFDACNTVTFEDGYATPWIPLWHWRNRVLTDLIPERGTGETVIDWMAQVERVAA